MKNLKVTSSISFKSNINLKLIIKAIGSINLMLFASKIV